MKKLLSLFWLAWACVASGATPTFSSFSSNYFTVLTNIIQFKTDLTMPGNIGITQLFIGGPSGISLSTTNGTNVVVSDGADIYAGRFFGGGYGGGDFFGDGQGLSNLFGVVSITNVYYQTNTFLYYGLHSGNFTYKDGSVTIEEPAGYTAHLVTLATNAWQFCEWQIPPNETRTNLTLKFHLLSKEQDVIPIRTAIYGISIVGGTNTISDFQDFDVEFPAGTNVVSITNTYEVEALSALNIRLWKGDWFTNKFTNSLGKLWMLSGTVEQW